MGWFELKAWKNNSKGEVADLTDADLEYIVKQIKDGCFEGEIVDGGE